MQKQPIIDSDITLQQALTQNPAKPMCSADVLAQLDILAVDYHGFDGQLRRGQIVVNQDVAGDIRQMFQLALEIKFPFSKVVPNAHPNYLWDVRKLVFEDNVTVGFEYRKIKDSDKLSLHAYGRAIDVNPMQNPYVRYKEGRGIIFPADVAWDPQAPGTLHKDHPIVAHMESLGWEWGGRWTRKSGRADYMHLQKM